MRCGFRPLPQNVVETGNNCIDLVAAYLTNLRVMQCEEADAPGGVTPAMIPARHAATMASVAAKARELLSELAAARVTVKPRKAPKNKAAEMSARMAAAASGGDARAGGAAAAGAAEGADDAARMHLFVTAGERPAPPAPAPPAPVPDYCSTSTCGSDSGDEQEEGGSSCSGGGHQDTSRENGGSSPRTSREEEERLLYALQGQRAGEETLKQISRASVRAQRGATGACVQALPYALGGAEARRRRGLPRRVHAHTRTGGGVGEGPAAPCRGRARAGARHMHTGAGPHAPGEARRLPDAAAAGPGQLARTHGLAGQGQRDAGAP